MRDRFFLLFVWLFTCDVADTGLARVRSEIFILVRCHHPNIVQLFDNFEDKTHLYLVLEILQGKELFDRIIKKKRYTEQEAAQTIKI